MNRTEFLALLKRSHQREIALNTTKGHDYAGDEDALSNFKVMGAQLGLTPEQVWAVYASKHWAAIMTYTKEGQVQSEAIQGRIDDARLYLALLEGLIEEKKPRRRKRRTKEEVQAEKDAKAARVIADAAAGAK